MRSLFMILCLLALAPAAQAARITLAGVANSSEPREPGTDYTAKPGYGAGLLLEVRMMPALSLELGALVMPRAYESSDALAGTTTKYSAKIYQFPALLRMHLGRFLSFGAGAYFARAAGDITTETKSTAGTSSQATTYTARNQTTSDFGALASLALYFRMAPLTYLTFDGRYAMGMKNNSTVAGSDRKFNDMQLLAGLQFGF